MSVPASISAPECAQNVGSWCERIWRLWSVDWLASVANVVITPGLRILLIGAIALIVRALTHRTVDRLTRLTANGLVPGSWAPWRDRVESSLLGNSSLNRRRERSESIGSLLKSISSFAIVVVVLILVLSELGINVAPLLASAGIAGVAIGFGAQNLVRDFLAGIALILEDQAGVGDIVDLGPASGTVVAVGLRTTTVRSADGTIWYVRNGEILRVGNSSQGEAVVDIDITLPFGADTARAGRIALRENQRVAALTDFADFVLAEPTLQGVAAMTHDSMTIRVTSTLRAGTQPGYTRAVRTAVKTAFDDEGILGKEE